VLFVLQIFIENECGSTTKHHHDEERMILLRTEQVRAPYPFPYGFVPGTRAPDGDCADCFVITSQPLHTGELVDCELLGLLEQTESGLVDHNVLAVPAGEPAPDLDDLQAPLTGFILAVFAGMSGRETTVGRFLGPEAALAYLDACRPPPPGT
jgi:inorganic pyrophosphatase